MDTGRIKELDHQYVMGTYGRYPIALVRGEGALVWDADGREYLDLVAGIAVDVLGHCPPAVVAAIKDQAEKLIHVSNLFYTAPGAALARRLVEAGMGERVFFCNSGAEANEGAIKLARKYFYRKGQPDRYKIITADHSFHGRTLATLTATGKPEIQVGFGPLPAGFAHVPFNDIAALQAAVDEGTAAVLLEAIQGESGIHPATPEYLQAARRITRERGALLMIDEVQAGMGRTGRFFGFQNYGIEPDVVTLAKGLGGGLPIGAIAARGEAATEGLKPGDHATTFGANPVACAAALATMEVIQGEGFLGQVREKGDYFRGQLVKLQQKYPEQVADVRGMGLMLALELSFDGKRAHELCFAHGILPNLTAGSVLRFLPPYVITAAQIDRAIAVLDQVIPEAAAHSANQ